MSNQAEISARTGAGGGAGGRAVVEKLIVEHLDSAYNLARWTLRAGDDAEDVVQEAAARALKFASGFRGGDGRAWFLTIVRNCCWTLLEKNKNKVVRDSMDAELESDAVDPAQAMVRIAEMECVRGAVESMPADLREMIVLRDMEGLSYKQIAEVVEVPIGTVMSRLSRARDVLRETLGDGRDGKDGGEKGEQT